MKRVEQISNCPYSGHRGKRVRGWLKKMVNRARRRAEKRDPEDAPRRRRAYIWGWS